MNNEDLWIWSWITYFLSTQRSIFLLVNHCLLFRISWLTNFCWNSIRVIELHNHWWNLDCYYSMDSLTYWTHKSSIFGLVNWHCHLMNLLASWRVKTQRQYIWITIVIWWIHFTCFLKTQRQHNYINELPLSFDGFTYILKTQGQHIICISKLPLSFDGFAYILKT